MEQQKWEDLPEDLLVEIFRRLDMKSLAELVTFVSKSWCKASFHPDLWQDIVFCGSPTISSHSIINPRWVTEADTCHVYRLFSNYIARSYTKFVITRSHGSAITVSFLDFYPLNKEILKSVAEGCPYLKKLVIGSYASTRKLKIPDLICNWKNLESLEIRCDSDFKDIVQQISVHCENFVDLSVCGYIDKDAASAIATLLPGIKILSLENSSITRESLVLLLLACKKLEHLDIVSSPGSFQVDDILEKLEHLVSDINMFPKYEDHRLEYYC